MWLCVCMCESTERGVLWERALLFHVFQPFRPLDSLCLCSVSAAAASVADDDVVIWPCIKCSFVATIVVVFACHLLGFLVFGGPLEGLCVCVIVWGAAGNHNYTRNGAHKNTSNTHIQSACVHVCVCCLYKSRSRSRSPHSILILSRLHAYTTPSSSFVRTHTHTHSERAQEAEGERENEESLIRQAAIAVVVHNSPQSPPLPWLSAGNRS